MEKKNKIFFYLSKSLPPYEPRAWLSRGCLECCINQQPSSSYTNRRAGPNDGLILNISHLKMQHIKYNQQIEKSTEDITLALIFVYPVLVACRLMYNFSLLGFLLTCPLYLHTSVELSALSPLFVDTTQTPAYLL